MLQGILGLKPADPGGMTYDEVEEKRLRAAQLAGQVGRGGFTALGSAIGARRMGNQAKAGAEAGREKFNSAFQQLLGGGMRAPTVQPMQAPTGGPTGTPFMPQQANTPRMPTGGMPAKASPAPQKASMATSGAFPASLVRTESGGNWGALNNEVGAGGKRGHGGRLQFGDGRLADAANAGVIPKMTARQFAQASPEVQMAVENWHFSDIDRAIDGSGAAKAIGTTINGVPVTRDGLRAVAHLGGSGGMQKFVSSGGKYNPSDSFGTSLTDYLKTHAGDTGGGQAPQGGQRVAQAGPMGGVDPALIELATSPWASPEQKSVLGMMLQQQIARNAPTDPMQALQLQKAQLEIDAMQNPQPEPRKTQFVQGVGLIDTQTGDVISEYDMPEEEGYRVLTPEEAAQNGLPEGTWQVGPDGKVSAVGGGGTNVTVNNGSEVGTIPQGYELFVDPETGARSMQPIAGGPKDTSAQAAVAKSNRDTSTSIITSAAERAREAASDRSVGGMVGAGVARLNPSSENAEVYRQVEVLQSNAKIENLTAMRAASPTGGALGAVSDKESQMLAAKSGALDPASPNFFRDLDDYERTLLQVVHGFEEGNKLFERSRGGSGREPFDPQTPDFSQMSDEELDAYIEGGGR